MDEEPYPCVVCHGRARRPPSWVCGGCFARLRGDLAVTAWAYEWLGLQMRALKPAWRSGTIARDGEPQPPFDVQLHDMRSRIQADLWDWARIIGEEHTPALAGPGDPSVSTVCRWLRARAQWCADQRWVDQLMYDVADLRYGAYALAPWERTRRDMALACPKCTKLTLAFYTGDDGVTCRNRACGRMLAWSDYHALVREWYRRNTPTKRTA